MMGDWNAVVGGGREDEAAGEFGYGKRNERGQMLMDFCKRMKMVVTDTCFKHEKVKVKLLNVQFTNLRCSLSRTAECQTLRTSAT